MAHGAKRVIGFVGFVLDLVGVALAASEAGRALIARRERREAMPPTRLDALERALRRGELCEVCGARAKRFVFAGKSTSPYGCYCGAHIDAARTAIQARHAR